MIEKPLIFSESSNGVKSAAAQLWWNHHCNVMAESLAEGEMPQPKWTSVATAALVSLFAGDAIAQRATRPDEKRRADAARESKIDTARAWASQQQQRVDELFDRAERFGVSPKFGTLGQGSGLAFGAVYRRDATGRWPLDLEGSARFSIRGYELYEFRLGRLHDRDHRTTIEPADESIASQFDVSKDRKEGLGLYLDVRYRHSPLHRFYGPGPDARLADRSSFLLRGASYDIVTEYQPRNWLGLAMRAGLLDLNVGSGRDTRRPSIERLITDASAVPGLSRQPLFLHLATGVALDGRDSAVAPRSGGMVGVLLSRFESLGGLEADFSRVALDARYFVPAFERSVVAVRALASSDRAADSARVPFYLQQFLGGGDTLRGFERSRFRDTSLLHLSAEYRFDVHRKFELAGFYDVGQVAPRLAAVSLRRFETSWGGGVRFKQRGKVKLRLDWARSREGQRLILSGGPAF